MPCAKSQTPDSALRHARNLLERGAMPPAGLVDATVARSWQRSIEAGLMPFGRPADPSHLSREGFAQAVERRRQLVTRARPVLEYLHAQTRGSGSLVILGDDRGVVLEALGDAEFVDRAERVALMPGASWHECHRGTNAIGTALAEGAAVTVHGGEHFLERNAFLTCTATPLAGPDGHLLGVLDISGHRRGRQAHTSGLVLAAAHMIENRIFDAHHEEGIRLRFHPQPDGIGTIAEGLAALDENGCVMGANRAGMVLLGMAASDIGRVQIQQLLHLRMIDIMDWGLGCADATMAVQRTGGQRLYLRVAPGRQRPRPARARPLRPSRHDPLAALDTGDEKMGQVIQRARKVLDKPIPLLVHGESGVGKEVLARAIHGSGVRRDKSFVAVNCAALPEHLIESELFGYAPGAFTGARREGSPGRIREARGGTLFLDEIADMPLPLQCRLLRVLQDRVVSPLGGGKAETVDFALIAASHRPLKAEVEAGRFRSDLYYRLNGLTLTLPALRDRGDFQTLVDRMIAELAPRSGIVLAPDLLGALTRYAWPGNLRQLAHTLRTAWALLDPGETVIDWCHLPEDLVDEVRLPQQKAKATACGSLREASDSLIQFTVTASGGNLSEAARRLGISRNTLYRRLRDLPRHG